MDRGLRPEFAGVGSKEITENKMKFVNIELDTADEKFRPCLPGLF